MVQDRNSDVDRCTSQGKRARSHPYVIYNMQANRGAVFVGTSHGTPAFAADAATAPKAEGCCDGHPDRKA